MRGIEPGRLVRDLRRRVGLTQRQLAIRAGTTTTAISRLELLTTVMRAHSVRYVVIGGIAMKRASGRPRDLEDATAVMSGD